MRIRIYQINRQRDKKNTANLSLEKMLKRTKGKPDWSIYDCVYEGDFEFEDLEEIFIEFSLNPPAGFTGRELSISDVVMIRNEDGSKSSFYCDTSGWKRV